MYVNPLYAERELGVLHEMIEDARFGLLVLCAGGPLAAHIPFVLRREQGPNGTLLAHVAYLVVMGWAGMRVASHRIGLLLQP